MKGLRVGLAVGTVLSAFMLVGPAAAARPTTDYWFYNCFGDGPSSFAAVKTDTQAGHPSAGSAFALTDGSGTYQILSYGDDLADPPGIRSHSSSYNLVCDVEFAGVGTTTVYGYFAGTP
jgi:hypothetical protein